MRTIESKPWQVEVYDDEVLPVHAFALKDVEREAAKYDSVGLVVLAKRSRQQHGRSMAQSELDVWTWRYPTIYRATLHQGEDVSRRFPQVVQPWHLLEWPMPGEILALIAAVRPQYDELEVWVPELRRAPQVGLSPILVGVLGDQRYLLARWAEALEPFEEIERRMQSAEGRLAAKVRDLYQDGHRDVVGCCVTASILSVTAVAMGFMIPFAELAGKAVFLAAAASTAASAAALLWRGAWLRSTAMLRWACEYAGWVIR